MTNPLREYSFNVKTSDGEDGIIQKIFETIGAKNKWCVELGALNGTHDSNSWNLIQNYGWSAVLLEGEPTYFDTLAALYKETKRVHPVSAFVSFEGEHTLDAELSRTPIPHDFDLFVLDIDGNDYHVWDSLQTYRPRVVCIEFNPTIPNDIAFVQARNMEVQQGSSLLSVVELGMQKGYRLIATVDSNAFFVLEKEFDTFHLPDGSIDFLRPTSPFYTRMYQLYDGTLVLDGYTKLLWHNIEIDQERMQVLPLRRRRYHARIATTSGVRMFKYFVRKLPIYPTLLRFKKWLIR